MVLISVLGTHAFADDLIQIPVKGTVTIVDITSEGCDTCEKMLPVIEKIEKTYGDKIKVVLVDFWKYPSIINKIKTNTSPTILIYDESGKEVFRNYGYTNEEDLTMHLKMLGIN